MLGRRTRGQHEFLFAGSLRDPIPDDHVLVRVDRVLDLGWLRDEVADCYAPGSGRPGIDPEAAVRLMPAGLLLGIAHDRRLMREAAVDIAIRWFAGYGLAEALPDHSSLTRIRQRWGAERFRRIFTRTVQACLAAGIAKGEVVHIDSTLVRADVSWEAIARRHADAVEAANGPAEAVCRTDPDAGLATDNRARRVEPAYEQHAAVDAEAGVVLDVAVTTGARHDTRAVEARLDAIQATTGAPVGIATTDAGYAITRVFAALEERRIEAIVPTEAERPPEKGVIPVRRFKLDAKHRIVRCPTGKILRPHGRPDGEGFQAWRARVADCEPCRLRAICFGPTMRRRAILLHKDHPALLRARRKHARWGPRERALYHRHRGRVEGIHGEAKTWHGLARAIRRGLADMQIQAFLTAAVINLERLADAVLLALFAALAAGLDPSRVNPPSRATCHHPGRKLPPTQQQREGTAFLNRPPRRV
jgi:transposase